MAYTIALTGTGRKALVLPVAGIFSAIFYSPSFAFDTDEGANAQFQKTAYVRKNWGAFSLGIRGMFCKTTGQELVQFLVPRLMATKVSHLPLFLEFAGSESNSVKSVSEFARWRLRALPYFTVTVNFLARRPFFDLTVMVALPFFLAVILPFFDTVATFLLLLFHFSEELAASDCS